MWLPWQMPAVLPGVIRGPRRPWPAFLRARASLRARAQDVCGTRGHALLLTPLWRSWAQQRRWRPAFRMAAARRKWGAATRSGPSGCASRCCVHPPLRRPCFRVHVPCHTAPNAICSKVSTVRARCWPPSESCPAGTRPHKTLRSTAGLQAPLRSPPQHPPPRLVRASTACPSLRAAPQQTPPLLACA